MLEDEQPGNATPAVEPFGSNIVSMSRLNSTILGEGGIRPLAETTGGPMWTDAFSHEPTPGRSRLCPRNKTFNRAFLFHSRKAGGTSLHSWLRKMGLQVKMAEGQAPPPGKYSRPDTLMVTSLRDPVERAISSYNYEGRWRGAGRVPFKERTLSNSVTLRHWMDFTEKWLQRRNCMEVWWCAQNCFTRWFSGRCKVTEEDACTAMRHIMSFDIVITTDEMKNETIVKHLMECMNTTTPIRFVPAWLETIQAKSLRRFPYNLSAATLRLARERNDLDFRLIDCVLGRPCSLPCDRYSTRWMPPLDEQPRKVVLRRPTRRNPMRVSPDSRASTGKKWVSATSRGTRFARWRGEERTTTGRRRGTHGRRRVFPRGANRTAEKSPGSQ